MSISVNNHTLCIDLLELFRAMPEEEQIQFIRCLSLQSNIIEMVVKYICDEDESGAWTSESANTRQDILCRIEKKHIEKLKDYISYSWEPLRSVSEKLRNIHTDKSAYWALYHDEILNREIGWEGIDNFFKRHHIESNYTTKEADADIEEIKVIIKEAMAKMNERVK